VIARPLKAATRRTSHSAADRCAAQRQASVTNASPSPPAGVLRPQPESHLDRPLAGGRELHEPEEALPRRRRREVAIAANLGIEQFGEVLGVGRGAA
jgi:hypothetical protein